MAHGVHMNDNSWLVFFNSCLRVLMKIILQFYQGNSFL